MCFVAQAMERGMRVSRPFELHSPYDLIVDAGGRLLRVQVKSTQAKSHNGYLLACRNSAKGEPYTAKDADILAGLVVRFGFFIRSGL